MLENLNELVRENVQDTVVNNSEIPNEQNEQVIQAASGSIFDTLKDQISSGNAEDQRLYSRQLEVSQIN